MERKYFKLEINIKQVNIIVMRGRITQSNTIIRGC